MVDDGRWWWFESVEKTVGLERERVNGVTFLPVNAFCKFQSCLASYSLRLHFPRARFFSPAFLHPFVPNTRSQTKAALWDKTRSFWDIKKSLSHERGSERSERASERVSAAEGASEASSPDQAYERTDERVAQYSMRLFLNIFCIVATGRKETHFLALKWPLSKLFFNMACLSDRYEATFGE